MKDLAIAEAGVSTRAADAAGHSFENEDMALAGFSSSCRRRLPPLTETLQESEKKLEYRTWANLISYQFFGNKIRRHPREGVRPWPLPRISFGNERTQKRAASQINPPFPQWHGQARQLGLDPHGPNTTCRMLNFFIPARATFARLADASRRDRKSSSCR